LARSAATLIDRIYRRAAHLLQIDEQLLQSQTIDDELSAHEHSVAESLQVIRYREGEEYAPHHDWVVSEPRNQYQPTRFATLLMYLNDDFEGGRTVFPRSVNSQNHDGLQVEPEQGMAVLFYNMLPDGNVDDLSQHGSEPVTRGEKVLAESCQLLQ
jgi:prolyl 4-hydroxylase